MENKPLTYEEYQEKIKNTPVTGNSAQFLVGPSYLTAKELLAPRYFKGITSKYIEDALNIDMRHEKINAEWKNSYERLEKENKEHRYDYIKYYEEPTEEEKAKRKDLFKKYKINYPVL